MVCNAQGARTHFVSKLCFISKLCFFQKKPQAFIFEISAPGLPRYYLSLRVMVMMMMMMMMMMNFPCLLIAENAEDDPSPCTVADIDDVTESEGAAGTAAVPSLAKSHQK